MTTLQYKSHARIEDLAVGECTIHRASGAGAARWWLLWFYVPRDTDGKPQDFCVPVNPCGSYAENEPGGKTWGLMRSASGLWQISPSINVDGSGDATPGISRVSPSLWHHTPDIAGVPVGEAWTVGMKP